MLKYLANKFSNQNFFTMEEMIPTPMSGYRIYQYLLILSPPQELKNRIMEVKKAFFSKYRTEIALWSKPHITLVKFVQLEITEERILNRLHQIAMAYHPVMIELQNYGSFPSHTIYINITSKYVIQNLVKQIRTEAQKLLKPANEFKPHFIMEPHLTVARQLQPWQYEKGWQEYAGKHFSGRFIADAMLLLKRPLGEFKYQIAQRFEFQNLPIGAVQGDLFTNCRI